jgi:hypothetical protein
MINTSPAVANLKSQWHTLTDLDRARAVGAIQRSGILTREVSPSCRKHKSLARPRQKLPASVHMPTAS